MSGPRIGLKVSVFEDVIDQNIVEDGELGRAWAPPEMVAWWQTVCDRLAALPAFAQPVLQDACVTAGYIPEDIEIEVMLCSAKSMAWLTESDAGSCLGLHLVNTPDGDPFGEESALSRKFRVLMVSDRDAFLAGTREEAMQDIDPERHAMEYLASYLNTIFHEIGHARLFAENSALQSPAEIETLHEMGEIGQDIFDCLTGYGIRALRIDGVDVWAEDMDEARDDMETFVEAEGLRMLNAVLTGALEVDTWLVAAGVRDDFRAALAPIEDHSFTDTPEMI
jgi:hypothetical protein